MKVEVVFIINNFFYVEVCCVVDYCDDLLFLCFIIWVWVMGIMFFFVIVFINGFFEFCYLFINVVFNVL